MVGTLQAPSRIDTATGAALLELQHWPRITVGVLALQGAVTEHLRMVEECGVAAAPIKRAEQLETVDGLIIPGGESTTIGKLLVGYGFVESIRRLAAAGLPILGTCAGLILLSSRTTEGDQPLLGLMDIEVRRNAFGRQRESFETGLIIPELGREPFVAVFIRAPWIESVGAGVNVLASIDDRAVLAEQGNLLVAAFHPELTGDRRLHRYFIKKIGATGYRPATATL